MGAGVGGIRHWKVKQWHVTLGQDTHCWVMLLWEIYLVIFFLFFLLLFFHLRSCQECGQWDSQAARVTVHQYQHDHHQYHHYCHHRYCHPPHGIIIIIILIFFIIIFDFLLRLENNLHHVFYWILRPQTFQQHTLGLRVGNNQKSMTFCIVLNEQRHWVLYLQLLYR